MTFELLGFKTIGQCVPLAVSATAGINASVAISLPEVQAKITGLLELQAQLTLNPPTLAASLKSLLQLVASFEAAIALGLPSASLDLSAVAVALAELNLIRGQLTAQLSLAAGFNLLLGTPGVALYRYAGSLDPIAAQLEGGNPFPGVAPSPLGAFVVAQDFGATEALRQVFGV